MPIIWGRYYTDEELRLIADELNQIGRNIERKSEPLAQLLRELEERRKANPQRLVF